MELEELVEALRDPVAYPDRVSTVEVRQTHISVVFLTSHFAYKVKKPVRLDFLDFSTLEKRRFYCEEEVRLNRRLAPSVYLGVVPIRQTPHGLKLEGEGEGEVIDWAVKMQRLPEEQTLLAQLRRGQLTLQQLEGLAQRLAAFHHSAHRDNTTASFGRYSMVASIMQDTLRQATALPATPVPRVVLQRVEHLMLSSLERLRSVIERRADKTCDCHGDLHLDHIYSFAGRTSSEDQIIDCIEFNERFRFIDPVWDIAFVAMDLIFHGRPDLATHFASAYFQAANDDEGRQVLPLYIAHRAAVRGQVDCLLALEPEVPEEQKQKARHKAQVRWLLALSVLEIPCRRPALVLVSGLPGVGKSLLARGLAERAGFVVLRTDVIRKERSSVDNKEELYSQDQMDRIYAECLHRAETVIQTGHRVVIDATFRQERHRLDFLDLAARWSVPVAILVCQVQPETARRRIAARKDDASDADWTVYQKFAGTWEPPGEKTRCVTHSISTEILPEESLAVALENLQAIGLWQ